MKQIKQLFVLVIFLLHFTLLPLNASSMQDIQVFTLNNKDGKITPQSIEKSFNKVGLNIVGNNNMNNPFLKRFGKVHYITYNLAMFINNDLSFKLIKKYPQFGALTPLTMSIWQDKDANINISTLSFYGMARATGIPNNDPDLRSYAALIHKALKDALPNGHFKKLYLHPSHKTNSFQINFTTTIHLENGEEIEDYIDDFEEEFEAEMESLGFLFPNITNVQEEIFDEYNYNIYDFYHTYSICKFDVIYPVSQLHPQAGAWAPCSFYIYKKKNKNKIHMGFLGVDNWITSLNIKDQTSIQPLKQAQDMIITILKEMIN